MLSFILRIQWISMISELGFQFIVIGNRLCMSHTLKKKRFHCVERFAHRFKSANTHSHTHMHPMLSHCIREQTLRKKIVYIRKCTKSIVRAFEGISQHCRTETVSIETNGHCRGSQLSTLNTSTNIYFAHFLLFLPFVIFRSLSL